MASITSRLLCMNIYSYLDGRHEWILSIHTSNYNFTNIYKKNRQFSLKNTKKPQVTTYYAHSVQDKLGNLLPYEHWQTLQSHSVNVGEMAAEFARVFGAQEIACQMGKLHDLGKYSESFNH